MEKNGLGYFSRRSRQGIETATPAARRSVALAALLAVSALCPGELCAQAPAPAPIAPPPAASAETGRTLTLTVDQAVDIALKNNLDIRQAEQDVAVSQANLRGAWAAMLMPTIQLAGSYEYTDVIQSAFAYPYNDTYSAGLQVTRALFAGGRYWFAKESARLSSDFALFKLTNEKKTIVRNTRTNFYNLLLLKTLLLQAQATDKYLKDHLDSTRINFQNGLASQLDYLTDQVKYLNNKPLLDQAENGYEIGKATFAFFLGLPAGQTVEPQGNLEDSTAIRPLLTDEDKILAAAVSLDLGVRTADYNILVSQANAAAAAASRSPSVSGNFTYAFSTRAAAGGREFSPGWTLTLSAVVPLDAWIPYVSVVSNQLMSADELTAKLKLAKEQAVGALRTNIKTLLLNITYAQASIESQKENMNQAKLALDIAQKQYREGTLSSLNLSNAEVTYNQAAANYLQALYAGYTNILALNDLIE
jgi:outer membrane protein